MDELLPFYQRELGELRKLGKAFSKKHPKVAGKLGLDSVSPPDPHIERLIEAVAFMNARIRYKLEDDFPEISSTLLNLLYPHYQLPVPSMLIAECTPLADMAAPSFLPRGTVVETLPEYGEGVLCQTVYDTRLLPIEITSAQLSLDNPHIKITLQCMDDAMTFAKLAPETLRLYIHAESLLRFELYELFFTQIKSIFINNNEINITNLCPVGFKPTEGLLPYEPRAAMAYRLLTEYFIFPEKFLFIEINHLDKSFWQAVERQCELTFYLKQAPLSLARQVNHETFKLHCVPLINLSTRKTEPVILSHTQTEYPLIVDLQHHDSLEVYKIHQIQGITEEGKKMTYAPFYGRGGANGYYQEPDYFWHTTRKAVISKNMSGEELYLSFIDHFAQTKIPKTQTLQIDASCFNRNIGQHPAFLAEKTRWQMAEASAPVSQIVSLTPPSLVLRPSLGNSARWHLLSHLSFNHQELSHPETGITALREMLKLYNINPAQDTNHIIGSLENLKTRQIMMRLPRHGLQTFCQGLAIQLTIDETKFSGSSVWLFSAVLEHFFARLASINTFTQLVVMSKNKQQLIHRFAPRIGDKLLL